MQTPLFVLICVLLVGSLEAYVFSRSQSMRLGAQGLASQHRYSQILRMADDEADTPTEAVSTPIVAKQVSAPAAAPPKKKKGGNQSKFGIFSPAVYVAKLVLGETKLNKIRGKAIALHSQAITEWCKTYGAYNLRTRLVSFLLCAIDLFPI